MLRATRQTGASPALAWWRSRCCWGWGGVLGSLRGEADQPAGFAQSWWVILEPEALSLDPCVSSVIKIPMTGHAHGPAMWR